MAAGKQRLNILLIGNNSETARTVTDALRTSNTRCHLSSAPLGARALACIRGEDKYKNRPRPDMILLDAVNADGATIRILKAIKSEPGCENLPVVVLSCDDSVELLDDLQVGDTRYAAFSPVDFNSFLDALNAMNTARFMQAIALLENFGFVLVRVPETRAQARDGHETGGRSAARRPPLSGTA